jgi:hypothetical protein
VGKPLGTEVTSTAEVSILSALKQDVATKPISIGSSILQRDTQASGAVQDTRRGPGHCFIQTKAV